MEGLLKKFIRKNDRLVTLAEASSLLGICHQTLHKYVDAGMISTVRISRNNDKEHAKRVTTLFEISEFLKEGKSPRLLNKICKRIESKKISSHWLQKSMEKGYITVVDALGLSEGLLKEDDIRNMCATGAIRSLRIQLPLLKRRKLVVNKDDIEHLVKNLKDFSLEKNSCPSNVGAFIDA